MELAQRNRICVTCFDDNNHNNNISFFFPPLFSRYIFFFTNPSIFYVSSCFSLRVRRRSHTRTHFYKRKTGEGGLADWVGRVGK